MPLVMVRVLAPAVTRNPLSRLKVMLLIVASARSAADAVGPPLDFGH